MRLSIFPIAAPLLLASALLASCKPEKVKPTEPTKEISKYDLIPGNYKMYDTLGNYLYEMKIVHTQEITNKPIPRDSLTFINFFDKYSFTTPQSSGNASNLPKYSFQLGSKNLLIDTNGKRAGFFGYESHFSNDSIYLNFKISNIKYYLSDMVPYFSKKEKQIGIKQH